MWPLFISPDGVGGRLHTQEWFSNAGLLGGKTEVRTEEAEKKLPFVCIFMTFSIDRVGRKQLGFFCSFVL